MSKSNPIYLNEIVRAENIFLNNQSNNNTTNNLPIELDNNKDETSNLNLTNENKNIDDPLIDNNENNQNKEDAMLIRDTLNTNSLSVKSPKDQILFCNRNLYHLDVQGLNKYILYNSHVRCLS